MTVKALTFKKPTDAGEPLVDLSLDYKAHELFTFVVPATGGPWLDSSGDTIPSGKQIFSYDADRTAADRDAEGGNPLDANEISRMTWHGSSGSSEAGTAYKETVLIDVEGANNNFYSFSTGETWAEVKANYDRLIITGNASQSGVSQVRPWSFILDLGNQTNGIAQPGFRMDFTNDYGVTIWANTPSDTDTGFTYRQSGGDVPTGGRMHFTVVGVKRQTGEKFVREADVISVNNGWELIPNSSGAVTGNLVWTDIGDPQTIITGQAGDEALVIYGSQSDFTHFKFAEVGIPSQSRRFASNTRVDLQVLPSGQIQVRSNDIAIGFARVLVKAWDARLTLPNSAKVLSQNEYDALTPAEQADGFIFITA